MFAIEVSHGRYNLLQTRNHERGRGSGGRLVSVMSQGPFYRADRKATEFREWFAELVGEKIDLPADSFKDGFVPTGVSTCLVVLDA